MLVGGAEIVVRALLDALERSAGSSVTSRPGTRRTWGEPRRKDARRQQSTMSPNNPRATSEGHLRLLPSLWRPILDLKALREPSVICGFKLSDFSGANAESLSGAAVVRILRLPWKESIP
jgi:hypothetical protein